MLNKVIKALKKIIPKKLKGKIYHILVTLLNREYYPIVFWSFSQAGEDSVLRFLFQDYPLELSNIAYLDIGARHPIYGNNTYLFYSYGSSGVCVDADKTFISLMKKERPRDKVLNVGVIGGNDESGFLYFMEGGSSTLDKNESEKRTSLGNARVLDVLNVPLLNINTLIKQNFRTYPVFLSIDIEGLDLSVLKGLDYDTYPIPVICTETCLYSENHVRPKDHTIVEFMISKGYEIYADTYVNTIFVDKKWFYNQR
jgi:FkbM family methyltransferase